MECTIRRSELLAGLGTIAEAVSSRARLPVLEHARVTATESGIALVATDTEVELRTIVAADIHQQGVITLPCHKVLSICRSLPSDATINIRLSDNGITVKSGRSRFVVHGLDPADFPIREQDANDDSLTVPVAILRGVLEKARQVMPQSDVRPHLNGILLKVNGAELAATATNGHVMILATAHIQESRITSGQWILPAKAVRALLKILAIDDTGEALAHLTLSANSVTVTVGQTALRSQLIDGRYPDVKRAIPRYTPAECVTVDVDRFGLKSLVERVSLMTVPDEPRASAVILTPEAGEIRARAGCQDGEAVDFVDANTIVGPEGAMCDFGANPNYCTAILAALDTERVQITLRDGNSGAIFYGLREGVVQKDVLGVMMPIRV